METAIVVLLSLIALALTPVWLPLLLLVVLGVLRTIWAAVTLPFVIIDGGRRRKRYPRRATSHQPAIKS